MAPGVEPLGRYQGSGYATESYLARRPDGEIVHLSHLLYLVLEATDGTRTTADIAARVTTDFGRGVSADNVDYLLNTKFAPLGLLAGQEAPPARDDGILTLKLRVTLLRERPVQFLGHLLKPLFWPPVILAVAAALAVFDVHAVRSGGIRTGLTQVARDPLLILLVLGLAIVSALFHECGHAAACVRGGARPGVIGMGIYLIWPAFFTNVTDSYRLTRGGRIRTDLGGLYFNGVFALVLAGCYLATGFAPLLWAIVLVHIEMAEQLIPTFRFDGYFILGDLAGVPDLFSTVGPVLRSLMPGRPADPRVKDLKRSSRIAITSWTLMVIPVIGIELAFLVIAGPQFLSAFVHSAGQHAQQLAHQVTTGQVASAFVTTAELLLLVLPLVGLAIVLVMTVRRLGPVLRVLVARRLHRRPPSPHPENPAKQVVT